MRLPEPSPRLDRLHRLAYRVGQLLPVILVAVGLLALLAAAIFAASPVVEIP